MPALSMTRESTATEDYRLEPHNENIEQATLGALILDREAIVRVSGFLKPEHFHRPRHAAVYAAMLSLLDKGEPADFVTLCDALQEQDKLEDVGGATYLAELTSMAPTSVFAEHWARLLEKLAVRRGVIKAAGKIAALAYQQEEPDQILDQSEALLYELRKGRETGKLIAPDERAKRAYERYEAATHGQSAGLPYGLISIDHSTGGAHRGELVLIAARPSVGKTSLMHCMAQNQTSAGRLVLFCSAEQPEAQLSDRFFAASADCTVHDLESGQLNERIWRRLGEAFGEAGQHLPWVFDAADMTTANIRSIATEMRSKVGLDAVYVDYIQTLHDRVREGEVERVTLISRQLKALARALDVPVIAASQLNRQSEFRADMQPRLSDLRESGSLEQDADVVLLLWRPDMAFPLESRYRELEGVKPDDPYQNACKVMIAKQRNGPRGIHVWLRFDPRGVRFTDLERRY